MNKCIQDMNIQENDLQEKNYKLEENVEKIKKMEDDLKTSKSK